GGVRARGVGGARVRPTEDLVGGPGVTQANLLGQREIPAVVVAAAARCGGYAPDDGEGVGGLVKDRLQDLLGALSKALPCDEDLGAAPGGERVGVHGGALAGLHHPAVTPEVPPLRGTAHEACPGHEDDLGKLGVVGPYVGVGGLEGGHDGGAGGSRGEV